MITFDYAGIIKESTNPNPDSVLQEDLEDKIDNAKEKIKDYAGKPEDQGGLGLDTDDIEQKWKAHKGEPEQRAYIVGDTATKAADALNRKLDNVVDNNRIDGRSIVARARNSIKQCPIYVTQTIRAAEGQLLSKLFEKVYASFFQAAIAQNPLISPEEARNLNFLNQYHTDIRESAKKLINEFYEPIDDFDAMIQESVFCEHELSERCSVQFSVIPTIGCERLLRENSRLMQEPLSGINYLYQEAEQMNSPVYQNDVTTSNDAGSLRDQTSIVRLSEEDLEKMAMDRLTAEERRYVNMSTKDIDDEVKSKYPDVPKPTAADTDPDVGDVYKSDVEENDHQRLDYREELRGKIADARARLEQETDNLKRDIDNGVYKNPAFGDVRSKDANGHKVYYYHKTTSTRIPDTTSTVTKSMQMTNKVPEFLRQTDIKKINGMDPYMMKATFIIRDPETKSNTEVSYIIGIKSVMHLIYVQDLADELYELVTGNVKSLQKVRYKTGEIGFADYMFNIKGLKADAAKNINYNKRWISTLKQLANYNKTRGSLLKKPVELLANGNTPIPNATLIITQTDVDWLVSKTGIDLSQISNARRLAKSLFLIAIAIVDPDAGKMLVFFPDRDTDWDVQSLASVEQEIARTDNSNLMKELQKAVNR